VILSGCGVMDGSEIHEATLTLYFLDKHGAEIICMAPNKEQSDVVDHLKNKPTLESRNVLAESARIARGAIRDIRAVKSQDLDGVILPDLTPEEGTSHVGYGRSPSFAEASEGRQGSPLLAEGRRVDFKTILLLAPTTMPDRAKRILRLSTGVIYYVSLTGVTGARARLPEELRRGVLAARAEIDKPVCVGFGISRPGQVRAVAAFADGVIVGSAIVSVIEKNARRLRQTLVRAVARFAERLKRPLL
jgi:tryptophan synthase alpha subunit